MADNDDAMVMKKSGNTGRVTDKRTQIRIEAQIPVKVLLPGCSEPITAINQDISWGGALLLLNNPQPSEMGAITIHYPWRNGSMIEIDAQMLRANPVNENQYQLAVRFSSLSPRAQSRLERLLKMLSSASGDSAAPPQALVRELEITVHEVDELRRMLMEVSSGRYEITVFDAYQVGQSISLAISSTWDLPKMRLRARVVEVQQTQAPGFDWASLYTLTLEFEHPKSAIKGFAKMLLGQMEDREIGAGYSEGVPGWVRAAPLAKPTANDLDRQSAAPDELSTLEADYPELLYRLVECWGDSEAFEIVYRDLTLSNEQKNNVWSDAAWSELACLQKVHDAAYGAAKQ